MYVVHRSHVLVCCLFFGVGLLDFRHNFCFCLSYTL